MAEDVRDGKYKQISTRFPPEPNGYLHIGHAKSICLNFGIAREFGGICNMRMDDTNPTKEETEYVDSIMADVRWLIGGWADKHIGGAPLYASDYFDKFYEYAVDLVRKGKAYVDDMTAGADGRISARSERKVRFRNRPVEENLDFFGRMKAGEFPDGTRTLRAKIDMNAAECLAPRSRALSHPARFTSSHRRQMVHLPDVRLGAHPERLHRGHHAFGLHA